MHCNSSVLFIHLTFLDIKDNKDLLLPLNIIRFCDFKLSVWLNHQSELNEIYTVD